MGSNSNVRTRISPRCGKGSVGDVPRERLSSWRTTHHLHCALRRAELLARLLHSLVCVSLRVECSRRRLPAEQTGRGQTLRAQCRSLNSHERPDRRSGPGLREWTCHRSFRRASNAPSRGVHRDAGRPSRPRRQQTKKREINL